MILLRVKYYQVHWAINQIFDCLTVNYYYLPAGPPEASAGEVNGNVAGTTRRPRDSNEMVFKLKHSSTRNSQWN